MPIPRPAQFVAPGLVALGALLLTTSPAAAQVEIGVQGSTLGIGVDVGYRPASHIGFRLAGHLLSFTRLEEVEGIDYDLTPDLQSFSGLVDLYPFAKVLHFTGGMVKNDNRASAVARIPATITLGSRTYTNTQIQALRGDLEWSKSMAPYAGFGLTSGGRIGISFEAGVVFSGTPAVTLTGTTTLTGAEKTTFDQAVLDEQAEVTTWIDDNQRFTKYYPVVALGLRFRF